MCQIGKDSKAIPLVGGSDLDKKISLVSWATVCLDKSKGGIGIKSFSKLNKAMLCKWSWRFANDRNALWRKVSKGGIGIKSFSKLNKALLCKWSWRFANDINALRRKAICCKFGEAIRGWHTRDLRGGYGTSLWKEIRKEWLGFF